ncbi:mannose-1-phosphate guanylyltransferase, partial [Bdellovibrionota bacterium]
MTTNEIKNIPLSVLLLAGGRGTRFWPKSQHSLPKQMLDLLGTGKSMIEETRERVKELVPKEKVFVSTGTDLEEPLSLLLGIPREQIIVEPTPKNSAPAIGLSATYLLKKHGDGVMIVLPSDHHVTPKEIFQQQILKAAELAWERHSLICFGIPPTRPATGYGYLEIGEKLEENSCAVKRFVEKPDLETAKAYLEEGNRLWNSGMFVWRTSAILNAIETHMPKLGEGLKEFSKTIGTEKEQTSLLKLFQDIEPLSIDYGVMEKHDNVSLISAEFSWDDLGSWESLTNYLPKEKDNWSKTKKLISINSKNNLIDVPTKKVAL